MTANSPNFFKQHPVLTHYILTFVISWGGILLAVGPRGIPGIPVQMERMIYRVLLSRLLQWRVGIGWYAVALLITPLLMMDARAQIVLKLYLKNSVLARLVRGRILTAPVQDNPMQILGPFFFIRMNSGPKKYLANLGQTPAFLLSSLAAPQLLDLLILHAISWTRGSFLRARHCRDGCGFAE